MRRFLLGFLLPLLVFAGAVFAAVAMIRNRPKPVAEPPVAMAPFVRVVVAAPRPETLLVRTYGTVAPRTRSRLTAEVDGRIVKVEPGFRDGAFFAAGEPLLRIESVDHRLALEQKSADVAAARRQLLWEEAEAEAAIRDWRSRSAEPPPALVAREPQLGEARARVRAAEAALEQAQRDLARTEIAAPYAGRVLATSVDVGQYVTRGATLAELYSVDFAEIRLPLPDEDLQYLELPLDARQEERGGPRVTLRAEFAGGTHEWTGQIVRTEGEIDPRTRMVHVIALVPDPYGRNEERPRLPLAVGMFVTAEIHGRTYADVVTIPRPALRDDGSVWIADAGDRLRRREVAVLRRDGERVLLRSGLAAGDRVVTSVLEVATEGMPVRPEPAR
jgi:RND family efflux transporter MFP subunit